MSLSLVPLHHVGPYATPFVHPALSFATQHLPEISSMLLAAYADHLARIPEHGMQWVMQYMESCLIAARRHGRRELAREAKWWRRRHYSIMRAYSTATNRLFVPTVGTTALYGAGLLLGMLSWPGLTTIVVVGGAWWSPLVVTELWRAGPLHSHTKRHWRELSSHVDAWMGASQETMWASRMSSVLDLPAPNESLLQVFEDEVVTLAALPANFAAPAALPMNFAQMRASAQFRHWEKHNTLALFERAQRSVSDNAVDAYTVELADQVRDIEYAKASGTWVPPSDFDPDNYPDEYENLGFLDRAIALDEQWVGGSSEWVHSLADPTWAFVVEFPLVFNEWFIPYLRALSAADVLPRVRIQFGEGESPLRLEWVIHTWLSDAPVSLDKFCTARHLQHNSRSFSLFLYSCSLFALGVLIFALVKRNAPGAAIHAAKETAVKQAASVLIELRRAGPSEWLAWWRASTKRAMGAVLAMPVFEQLYGYNMAENMRLRWGLRMPRIPFRLRPVVFDRDVLRPAKVPLGVRVVLAGAESERVVDRRRRELMLVLALVYAQ